MYLYELVKPQAVCRLTVRHWEENYTLYSTVGTGSKREKSLNPLSTALPSWGQSTQFLSSLSPKRACGSKRVNTWYSIIQLRRGVLNRTYGKHKNLVYISLFLVTIFGPIYYGPPWYSSYLSCISCVYMYWILAGGAYPFFACVRLGLGLTRPLTADPLRNGAIYLWMEGCSTCPCLNPGATPTGANNCNKR